MTSNPWPTRLLILIFMSPVRWRGVRGHALPHARWRWCLMNIYIPLLRRGGEVALTPGCACWVLMRRIERRICATHVRVCPAVFFLSLPVSLSFARPPSPEAVFTRNVQRNTSSLIRVRYVRNTRRDDRQQRLQRSSRQPVAATTIALCISGDDCSLRGPYTSKMTTTSNGIYI